MLFLLVREWRLLVHSTADCYDRNKLELSGAWNPQTVRELCWLCKVKRPNLVFLMETKFRQKNMEKIRSKLGFPNCFMVDCVGRSEGLALLWKDGVELEIQNYSRRHINAIVLPEKGRERWKFTGFYGNPETHKRHEAWALLSNLADFEPRPWMCMGDFNEIMARDEKLGGNERAMWQIEAFRDALSFCELADLGCRGAKFTWNNGQEGEFFIPARLDRGIANSEWRALYPEVNISTEVVLNSDHMPLLFSLDAIGHGGGRKRMFRYESQWVKEKGSKKVIEKVWQKKYHSRDKWTNIKCKLDYCSNGLLRWRKKEVGATETILRHKSQQLELLQRKEGELEKEKIMGLKKEVQEILEKEEIKWKQHSKEAWLKEGDKNTKYFHACATQRKKKNFIGRIIDENGVLWESSAVVEEVFIKYYKNLFTLDTRAEPDICLDEIHCHVTLDMNEGLMKDFSVEEVTVAVQQMSPHKAPGPDGFSAGFFQDN